MNSRIFLRKTLRAAALPRFAPLPLGKTAAHLRLEQQTNSHMWSQKVDDGIIGLRERKKHAGTVKAASSVLGVLNRINHWYNESSFGLYGRPASQ